MNVQILPNGNVRLMNAIISFPHLFVARAATQNGQPSGAPRFTANFIIGPLAPQEQAALDQAVAAAITKQWAGNAPSIPPHKLPFKDPTGPAGNAAFAGRVCISGASPGDKPGPDVVRVTPQGLMKMTAEDSSQLFGGCIVHCEGRFFGYAKGSNGVSFAINSVVLVENENITRLDNRQSVTEAWGDMYGAPAAGTPPPVVAPVAQTTPMPMGGPVPGFVPAPGYDPFVR